MGSVINFPSPPDLGRSAVFNKIDVEQVKSALHLAPDSLKEKLETALKSARHGTVLLSLEELLEACGHGIDFYPG